MCPWYANHTHGWGGPAFGYILGFVLSAGLVGALPSAAPIGTTWLALDLRLGAADALRLGLRPFLVTDALKIAIATLAFGRLEARLLDRQVARVRAGRATGSAR